MDSTSTIWCISNLTLFETSAAGALKDFFVGNFGVTNSLLILLLFACFGLYHQRNQIRERDDREKTFERSFAALRMRADALEAQLKLCGDQSKLVEQRGKIIEQRDLLIDQKLAVGEELLRLEKMRSLVGFLAQPPTGALFREILLVEDERALHYFKEGIEAEIPGIRVRLANNGGEALAAVMIRRPGLIITDLVMPVLDGYQLIEKVRDNYPDIAVLAISSYVDNAAQIASRIGALPAHFEFLPKPTLLAPVLAAIRRLLIPETDTESMAVISAV